MSKPKNGYHARFGLTAFYSVVVFAILMITSMLIFIAGVFLVRANVINLVKISRSEPMLPIFMLLVISVLVGTVVSFIISRIPLKPIRRVIDATNRLADGDFSVSDY